MFLLAIVLALPLSIFWAFVSTSMDLHERLETYIDNRKELGRIKEVQFALQNANLSFIPSITTIERLDKEFAKVTITGTISGLNQLAGIESYLNFIAISHISIDGQVIDLPKPDPWENRPCCTVLGTDEPLQIAFGGVPDQEVVLITNIPLQTVYGQTAKRNVNITALVTLWSQSPTTYEQKEIWSESFETVGVVK